MVFIFQVCLYNDTHKIIIISIIEITYEVSLERPDTEEWTAPAPVKDLIEKMNKLHINAKQLLMKNGKIK